MALFVCQTKCQWRERLWKPGEKMSYPTELAAQVPHHFERVDAGAAVDVPQPQRVADVQGDGYDPREVACIVGMHHMRRNKLLSNLAVDIPSNAQREEVAKLIIDAARIKGIDPLNAEERAKITAAPVAPKLVGDDAPDPVVRVAQPSGSVSIADTI